VLFTSWKAAYRIKELVSKTNKYVPSDLNSSEFKLLDEVEHQNIMPFLRAYLKENKIIFYSLNLNILIFFAVFFYLLIQGFIQEGLKIGRGFQYFSYGVGITFLLIPVHEYLHVIAYRLVGASNTYLDMNLKRFYFMALADRSVVHKNDFIKVILTPFLSITLSCLLLFFLANNDFRILLLGLFLTHSVFCSGDFGLLSYIIQNSEKDIYTYDDKSSGKSYFFERIDTAIANNSDS